MNAYAEMATTTQPIAADPALRGRRLVITGGASGIGRACAELAAAGGAAILLVDLNGEHCRRTVEELAGSGHHWLAADVADANHADRLRDAWQRTGFGSIDAVIACAGIASTGSVLDEAGDELQQMLDVNVVGIVNTVRSVRSLLADDAAIVATSSIAAYSGGGYFGGSGYAASKAAVIGLMRGLARDLAPSGTRVNAVAPGPVDTPMIAGAGEQALQELGDRTLAGRVGTASEVAEALLFLASPRSSYITGQVLHVNGGMRFG
jgi:3-oxoacyl-[acyl-carrier protein] reductase